MKWTFLIGWYEIHDHKNVNRSVRIETADDTDSTRTANGRQQYVNAAISDLPRQR